MELNKNGLQTFYIWVEWKILANQAKLIPSLITSKRDIRRVTCKKGKQPEYPIYKIIIIECPIYGKIVEEDKDHYCSPNKEMDLTILTDKLWQDTTHLGSQILLKLIEE